MMIFGKLAVQISWQQCSGNLNVALETYFLEEIILIVISVLCIYNYSLAFTKQPPGKWLLNTSHILSYVSIIFRANHVFHCTILISVRILPVRMGQFA